jgi:adenine specific DNA methylase Mod
MRGRIKLLYKLLSKDGSIWISVDDSESHYLKVMADEIFGRVNFNFGQSKLEYKRIIREHSRNSRTNGDSE